MMNILGTIRDFLKSAPLKYWGIFVLLVLILAAGVGRADKKLYQLMRESIERDVRVNEETLLMENERLNKDRDALLAERSQLTKERAALQQRVAALERKKDEIEARLNAVSVPANDDDLAEAFRGAGFHPVLFPKR